MVRQGAVRPGAMGFGTAWCGKVGFGRVRYGMVGDYVVKASDSNYKIVPAMQIIGALCNLFALYANGWTMPYNLKIAETAENDYIHTYMPIANMKVWFLCDVIYNFSIGDIILFLSILVCTIIVATRRPVA
jgi:hypothetical protein